MCPINIIDIEEEEYIPEGEDQIDVILEAITSLNEEYLGTKTHVDFLLKRLYIEKKQRLIIEARLDALERKIDPVYELSKLLENLKLE